MKRIKMMLCGFMLFGLILVSGCSKNQVDTFSDVSNGSETINSGKSALTVEKIYSEIRKNQDSAISEYLLEEIIKNHISLEDANTKALYKKYLNQEFNKLFNTENTYKVNGVLDEKLVVEYLKSETYEVTCSGEYDTLLDEPFLCDYTDYIEKELNFDIYMKILKVKYLIDEKSNMIDKQEGRRINYYKISTNSSGVDSIREEIVKYVESIANNYASTEDDVIKNLQDVAKDKQKQDIKKIEDEFKKLSTSDDSNFSLLTKFTTCGTVRCSVEEGKQYLIDAVENYYTSEVVIKTNDSILYESARKILFGENIEDNLRTIGNKKYLVSPVYVNDTIKDIKDIILFNNVSSSLAYYLVEVEVIDSDSNFLEQAEVAELLLDKIGESEVLEYYFGESEITIHDKLLNDLFIKTYGEYKGE